LGLARFIPVRADDERILTCFLEDEGDAVRVHDLLYTRDAAGAWHLGKSSYRKLKLAPSWVAERLQGYEAIEIGSGPRGMTVITARAPEV
jgi:hypothetical protein